MNKIDGEESERKSRSGKIDSVDRILTKANVDLGGWACAKTKANGEDRCVQRERRKMRWGGFPLIELNGFSGFPFSLFSFLFFILFFSHLCSSLFF